MRYRRAKGLINTNVDDLPYLYVSLAPRGNKTAYTLAMTSQTYAMRGA